MQGFYAFLADVVVAVHLGYVAFVVFGLAAILAGLVLGWRWVHNPWFRWIHLAMICIVAAEALMGITCPLTVWENGLRALAGQDFHSGTFVGRLLQGVMFPAWPDWLYLPVYVGFAALVVGVFLLAPPHYSQTSRKAVKAP